LRAAARALALDPASREPADLVGRLMLEPPKTIPPEVETSLERLDLETLTTSARFGLFVAVAYLAFFPMLYWIGFRDLWYLLVGPAISIFIIWAELVVAPRNPFLSGYLAIAGNLAMFAMFAWMTSPIIVGPGPAVILVTLLATHQRLVRTWWLAAMVLVATLMPWLAELFGSASRTSVVGGDIVLHTVATELGPFATMVGLVVYLVALVTLAALIARLQDDERRVARQKLELQAWQLKQLVPRSSGEVVT
jgi:hypothetical protein